MNVTRYLSATSPRGERYLRRFDTVTAARAAELLLLAGWHTRPLLTVSETRLGEQDDDQRRPTRDGRGAPILSPVGATSSCSPSCVVCDDQGCEFCPATVGATPMTFARGSLNDRKEPA